MRGDALDRHRVVAVIHDLERLFDQKTGLRNLSSRFVEDDRGVYYDIRKRGEMCRDQAIDVDCNCGAVGLRTIHTDR